MTDRVHSITLVLDKDIREDDVEPLLTACAMLKCVIKVKTNVSNPTSLMAEARARHDLQVKVLDALKSE